MENQLTKELKKAIQKLDDKYSKDKQLEKFEKSSAEFERMVEKGLTKKRGNNSFSVLDTNTHGVTFNQ